MLNISGTHNSRVFAVLADFFTDNNRLSNNTVAIDYERGIVIKASLQLKQLEGRTIVVSRNSQNKLALGCEVSGVGAYDVVFSISWTARAEKSFVLELKSCFPDCYVDMDLCNKLLNLNEWKFSVLDLVRAYSPPPSSTTV